MIHIPIILAQHAEDAAVLWQRRKRAVDAPHYNRMYLGRLDEQLEAHIDGLRVAGDAGWEECLAAFEDIGGEGEAFALSTLAFGHDDASRVPDIVEKVTADPKTYLAAAASGIGWLHPSKLSGKVSPLLTSDDPVARAIGVSGCAVHRVDPGKHMMNFLSDVPGVRRRAVRLAGEIGRVDLLPRIQELTTDADVQTAYWAKCSAVLLGDRGEVVQDLLTLGQAEGLQADRALRIGLTAIGTEAGKRWLDTQPATPEMTAKKITGYGILGDTGAIPWLIEQMADTSLAQIAGESYALITGADLEEDDLDGEIPGLLETGPNDDPNDHNVDLDENENLAWASADLIAGHWHKAKAAFTGGAYVLGQPAGVDGWQQCFGKGYQRQRRVAATWLAVGDPSAQMLNWKVPVLGGAPQ